jgi:hypothetical protein
MPRQTLEYYHQLFAQRGIDPSQYSGANGQFLPLLPNLLGRPLSHDEMDYNLELLDEVVRNYRVMNSNGDTTALGASDVNKYLKFANVNGEYVWTMDAGSGSGGSGDKGEKGEAGSAGEKGEAGSAGDKGEVGEKGSTGSGEKGEAGSAGDKGEAGSAGDKGEVGEKGSTGSGEKGEAGAAGDKGEAGSAGDKGDTGTQGTKGEKGADGADANGTKGEKGEAGSAGEKGEAGSAGDKGATGEKGSTGSGDKGDAGEKGEAGSAGDKGATGDKGSQGDKGEAGDKGDVGEKGEAGSAGDKGATGEKGDAGDKGDTGTAGDKGDTGATGDKGSQGDKGDAGDKGSQGDKGESGEKGATGEKGDAGEKGVRGDQGSQGGCYSRTYKGTTGTPPPPATNNTEFTTNTATIGTGTIELTLHAADPLTLYLGHLGVGCTISIEASNGNRTFYDVITINTNDPVVGYYTFELGGPTGVQQTLQQDDDYTICVIGLGGEKGETGTQGAKGDEGDKGDKGDHGNSANSMDFTIQSVTGGGTPGTGEFTVAYIIGGGTTFNDINEIQIENTSSIGSDATEWLDAIESKARIRIEDLNNDNFGLYEIGSNVDNTTHHTFSVSPIAHLGSLGTNGDAYKISYTDVGQKGEPGSTGLTGGDGPTGARGDKGDVGDKGEPGALGGAVAYSELHDAFVTPSTLNLNTSFTGWNTGGFGETNNVTNVSGSGPAGDSFEIIESGVYQFVGSFAIQSSVNNSEITAAIFINGVEDTDTTTTRSFGSNNTSGSFTITDLLDLTAGDVVDIRFKSNQSLTMTIINISANIVKNSGIGDKGEPGSGGNIETLDEGVLLTTTTDSYNFVGSGVTATKDPVTDDITVTIPDSTITYQPSVLTIESGFNIATLSTWSNSFDLKIDDSVLSNNITVSGSPGAYSGFVANTGGWHLFEFSISSSSQSAPNVYVQIKVNGTLYRQHQLVDPNGTSHTMSTSYYEYLELGGGDVITFEIINDDVANAASIEKVSFQLSRLKYTFGS